MLGSAVPPCRTTIFSGGQFLAGAVTDVCVCDASGLPGTPDAGATAAAAELVEPEVALPVSHVVALEVFFETCFFGAWPFGGIVDCCAAEDEGLVSGTAAGGVFESCSCPA